MNALQRITQSKNFKKIVMISFFALSGLTWLGMSLYGHFYVNTEDAYVNAHVVQITPRITGKVVNLHVTNNQYVKKGDPLFDIDLEPYQVSVDAAQAEYALASAELDNATKREERTSALVTKKYLSPQEGDNALADYRVALARVSSAKAQLAQANLNLSYTHITAPVSGWVTNVTLRTGDIVPANQSQFALISDEEFWVDANFKETEIGRIRAGQIAKIESDMYPHHPFKGVVESISGGAGAAFSLLPPQNATGNWVKVTQRVPVRIRVIDPSKQFPLRIGTSASVTVHLTNTKNS